MNQKEQIIDKLIELAIFIEEEGEATEDTQMQFLANCLKLILHATQNSKFANLFKKYVENYIMEYALITEQINIHQYLNDKIQELLN